MAEIKRLDIPDNPAQSAADSKAAKDKTPMPESSMPTPTPAQTKVDDGLEPPTPFDIPNPDKVVSFDKINAAGTEKPVDDVKHPRKPAADKADSGNGDKPAPQRGRPPQSPNAKQDKTADRTPKKSTQAAPSKNEPEAPAPPPTPREAPRPAEVEQVVFSFP